MQHLKGMTKARRTCGDLNNNLGATSVNPPVGNLLLVGHANDGGNLWISFDDKVRSGKGHPITFDDLDALITSLSVHFPAVLVDTANPQSVRLHGCRIGRAWKFTRKLRQAFGGALRVTAPKHFDHFFSKYQGAGTWEWLEYDFTFASKDFPLVPRGSIPEKFAAANTDFNGKPIDIKRWRKWIPRKGKAKKFSVVIAPKTEGVEKRQVVSTYRHGKIEHLPIRVPKVRVDEVNPREDAPTLLKRVLPTEPLFQGAADDPSKFPFHEQQGFGSIGEFVDAFVWTFAHEDPWWPALGEKGKKLAESEASATDVVVAHGFRRVYSLRVAVTDENEKLLFNYASPTEIRDELDKLIANPGLFTTCPGNCP
jgi:hypothetical protein